MMVCACGRAHGARVTEGAVRADRVIRRHRARRPPARQHPQVRRRAVSLARRASRREAIRSLGSPGPIT
jgi:hypothetical protein